MVIINTGSSIENARDPIPFDVITVPQGPFMAAVEIWHHDIA